ncbi:hypothetical protein [Jiella avicenniae]|uniref:Beta-barrel assembly machine subunit BamF n=1 Tax=Jiella avicenniae TaxID=2907202 RepID=A0A9X1T6A4_9HYPH|nr:hypothetical protein [Jiella avicenniae]MCE7030042.1 hypothetical protein [Jiella avicenniae]
MIGQRAIRALAAAALAAFVSGCQSADDAPMSAQNVAYRPVAPDGSSGQRLGADGYPLLGAYPNAAAPQIDDASVAAQEGRARALAARRKGGVSTRGYEAEIARMKRIKRQQAQEVETALAKRPERNAVSVGTGVKPSRSPEDVLREIQSAE